MTTTPEVKFCVKYLLDHGVNILNFGEVVSSLSVSDPRFELVRLSDAQSKPFFDELAEKLRELWPPGEKSGKYPWRDSTANLSRRLKVLWDERFVGKTFTIEECLSAARQYLAQFENDTTYMQTLKYFILKQEQINKPSGHFTIINKSTFGDILEGKKDFAKIDDEWNSILVDVSAGEGELI